MGKRKGYQGNTPLSDDDNSISSDQLLRNFLKKPSLPVPSLHLDPPKFNLNQISDNRRFHPEPHIKPVGSLKRSATQLVVPPAKKTAPRASLPHQVAFKAPAHVVVCVRRKQRKEVLFAKKLTGRGSRARKHHRNTWSGIKC